MNNLCVCEACCIKIRACGSCISAAIGKTWFMAVADSPVVKNQSAKYN